MAQSMRFSGLQARETMTRTIYCMANTGDALCSIPNSYKYIGIPVKYANNRTKKIHANLYPLDADDRRV